MKCSIANIIIKHSQVTNFYSFQYQDLMYDTCLGNPCKSGEICENKKDAGGVVCVKDQEGKTNTYTRVYNVKLNCLNQFNIVNIC